MVKIPRFTNTNRNVPVIQQQFIDPDAASKALNVAARGVQTELSAELNKFQQLNAQAERQEILTQELEHKANLQTALPSLYAKLGLQVSDAVSAIKAVDEEQRNAEMQSAEDVYLTTNSIRFQEDFMHFSSNLESTPDGSGYTKDVLGFINEKSEQILKAAPSERARMEMFSYLGKFKIDATQKANRFEKEKRIEFRQNEFVNAAESLRFQATENPDLVDTYVSQLTPYKNALLSDGVPEKQVNEMLAQAVEQIEVGRIEGLVKGGKGMQALGELNSPTSKDRISNERYMETHEVVAKSLTRNSKKVMAELRKVELAEKFQNGFIPSNTKEHKEIQSSMFKEYIGKYLQSNGNTIEGVSPRDIQQATVDFYAKFPNLKLADEHKNALTSGILHGAPEVALQNALMVEALRSNPKTALTTSALTTQTEAEAYKIVQLNQAGLTPEEAVQGARDILRKTDPNRLAVAKEQAKAFLKENPMEDLLDDAFDTWYMNFSNVDGVKEAAIESKQLFEDLVAIHGDVDIAKKQLTSRLTQKFAVTDINGSNELMAFAPNKYYSAEEMDWFQEDLGTYLNNVVIESGHDVNLVKASNDDWSYKVVQAGVARDVVIKSLPNVTNVSADRAKEYGIFFKDTNQQVKLNDLNEDLPPLPLGYIFDVENNSNYIAKKEANAFNEEADRKWREDQRQQYKEFKRISSETADARGLTAGQKSSIIRPYTEFERDLAIKEE